MSLTIRCRSIHFEKRIPIGTKPIYFKTNDEFKNLDTVHCRCFDRLCHFTNSSRQFSEELFNNKRWEWKRNSAESFSILERSLLIFVWNVVVFTQHYFLSFNAFAEESKFARRICKDGGHRGDSCDIAGDCVCNQPTNWYWLNFTDCTFKITNVWINKLLIMKNKIKLLI